MSDNGQYIRDTYHVPAVVGGRIRYIGRQTEVLEGVIISCDHNITVRWDDGGTARLHPTYHVIYLNENGWRMPDLEAT